MALQGDGKMAGIPAALHKKGKQGLRRRSALVLSCFYCVFCESEALSKLCQVCVCALHDLGRDSCHAQASVLGVVQSEGIYRSLQPNVQTSSNTRADGGSLQQP